MHACTGCHKEAQCTPVAYREHVHSVLVLHQIYTAKKF